MSSQGKGTEVEGEGGGFEKLLGFHAEQGDPGCGMTLIRLGKRHIAIFFPELGTRLSRWLAGQSALSYRTSCSASSASRASDHHFAAFPDGKRNGTPEPLNVTGGTPTR